MPLEPLHTHSSNGSTPPPQQAPSEPGRAFSFSKYIRLNLRRWYLLALAGVLGLVAAWAYLRYTPRQYMVNTLIRIKIPERGNISPEQTLLNQISSGASGNELDTELRILRSREIMRQVVEKLKLDVSFYLDGLMKDTDLYSRRLNPMQLAAYAPNSSAYGKDFIWQLRDDSTFFWRWESEEQEEVYPLDRAFTNPWGLFLVRRDSLVSFPDKKIMVRFESPGQVAADFRSRMSTATVRGTDLVRLSMKDPIPQRAADVLREVMHVYDQESRAYQNQRNNAVLDFVDERIRLLSTELDSVGQRVEDFVLENDLIAGPSSELQEQLAELKLVERSRAELQNQLDLLSLLEEYITRPSPKEDTLTLIPFQANIQNLNLSGLLSGYNQLVLERNKLAEVATPENPTLIAMNGRIDELKTNMLLAVNDTRRRLLDKFRSTENAEGDILAEIQTIPSRERGLLNIERQKQIKENLYLFLLQRREETALTRVITGSNVRVIEPVGGGEPIGPEPYQAYLIGLLGALLIPLGWNAGQVALDQKIHSVTELKKETDIPYLGTIGYSRKKTPLVIREGTSSALAEQFRMLRTNIHFQAAGGDDQVILVSSAVSGEGKSFISLNLAMTLALGGKSVCLVGFDLRRPQLFEYLKVDAQRPGLSNFLAGSFPVSDLIQPSDLQENLSYIHNGPLPPNPAELLLTGRTNQLFEDLRRRFDHIVLDTPPLGLVTDALLLGRQADLTIFVTRFRQTTREHLHLAREVYREQKLPNLGILFNGVKNRSGYGYNSYGSKAYYVSDEG